MTMGISPQHDDPRILRGKVSNRALAQEKDGQPIEAATAKVRRRTLVTDKRRAPGAGSGSVRAASACPTMPHGAPGWRKVRRGGLGGKPGWG